MKKSAKHTPPKSLSERAKKFWTDIRDEYELDDFGGLSLLTCAAESLDRQWEAAAILEKEGLIISDRFKQSRPHPACAVERDSKNAFLASMRALDLCAGPAPKQR